MKLLADVNVDKAIVNALRGDGHEVVWLAEDRSQRRLPDETLLRSAYRDGQVILTNDTGSARYVLVDLLPARGAVLSRVVLQRGSRAEVVRRVIEAFRAYQGTLNGSIHDELSRSRGAAASPFVTHLPAIIKLIVRASKRQALSMPRGVCPTSLTKIGYASGAT